MLRSIPHTATLALTLSLAACAHPAPTASTDSTETSAPEIVAVPHPSSPPKPPCSHVAAFTAGGSLSLVELATGALVAEQPADASAPVRDIAFDPWRSRLYVFESDEEEQSGEIGSHPIDLGASVPTLAPREHRAWVDGRARILPSPTGLVVFEEGMGEFWKVLWNDGTPAVGVAAPRPASAWLELGERGAVVHALSHGDFEGPALALHQGEVSAHPFAKPVPTALGLAPGGDSPTARFAPALSSERQGAESFGYLVDVTSGSLRVRAVEGGAASPAVPLALPEAHDRVEHAVFVGADSSGVLVLLTSNPTRLVAVRVDASGPVGAASSLELPGAARVEDRFFSRDLVALGGARLLVATSAGVFAVSVEPGGALARGPELALDPSFDGARLRGPLAPLPAPATLPDPARNSS